ncbi:MAG: tetratricopeptide repeat protein [Syntrophales bacterium]|jgi:Tfp pilus assembly protein PilF
MDSTKFGAYREELIKRREVIVLLLLIAMTLFVYWPVQHFGFMDFDDNLYVTDNSRTREGLSWDNVLWAFQDVHTGYWQPLTWLSLMLDYEFYGLHPSGYHWTNLNFHLLNIILLFFLLKRMTRETWKVVFVTGLFALHPINVESVAWVAERKNVLSTFFCFLTLYFYILYTERRNAVRYFMVVILFVFGLLSKPMLVTLPVLLILMDYWPLRRFQMHDACRLSSLTLEKVPLFLLSLASGMWTFHAAKKMGAVMSVEKIDVGSRLANAVMSYTKYVGKLFSPFDLAAFYPYPVSFTFWPVFMAALFLLFVTCVVMVLIRRSPYLFSGWAWYLVVLFPVIGIIQAGEQAMADRYAYLSFIGIFVMLSWGVADWLGSWKYRGKILSVLFIILMTSLLLATTTQLKYWRSTDELFKHAIQVTSNNILAYNARGNTLASQGKLVEAVEIYQDALRIRPDYVSAHNNLGLALAGLGRLNEAILHYTEAIRLQPDYVKAYNNLGMAVEQQGNIGEAEKLYHKALVISPDYASAHNNLGVLLAKQGRVAEAVEQFNHSLSIDPDDITVLNNMGTVLVNQGKPDLAVDYFMKALKLDPEDPALHNYLGIALASKGEFNEALRQFVLALQLNPQYEEARRNLMAVHARIIQKIYPEWTTTFNHD